MNTTWQTDDDMWSCEVHVFIKHEVAEENNRLR